MAVLRGDPATAVALSEKALACSEYAALPERMESLYQLTVGHGLGGHYDETMTAFEEARRCSAATGDRSSLTWALLARSVAEFLAGENKAAIKSARQVVSMARDFNNGIGISAAFTLLLCSSVGDGDFDRAAVLHGARQRIRQLFRITGFALTERENASIEAASSQIRAELGEARFEAAVGRGLAFTADEAVAYALGAEDEPATAADTHTVQAEPDPLTARERQVAQLVAQGMSNKQIAAALVIGVRTAEGHVERILTKLGFTSRTQIAAEIAHRDD